MEGPNPLAAGLSMLRARRVGRPRSSGTARAPGSGELGLILESVRLQGVAALPDLLDDLDQYTLEQSRVDPDELTHDDALAYWLNLYNAGALVLAGEAFATATGSVLRLPGAFTSPFVTVAGESLSLDAVEHGKIRRFGDPRIHSALVCGSASCPTLRFEPYEGARLDEQLDDQTRSFLEGGGAVIDEDTLRLSRVFLWYGADFVRPRRMPTFMPAGKRQVAEALTPWLPDQHTRWLRSGRRSIAFQSYDWSLACSVRKPV
ncbi:MAG: DUF547 domain-containing protein [Acidimicrobiia bacterium]|nr:MAG: DUF547 domain-containing protein [Acidimicrobiia bacterium]